MLRYLWLPCLLIAGSIACGGGTEAENPNFPSQGGQNETVSAGPDGARIYKTRCVTCHGSKGDMGANGAANLQMSQLPLEDRIATVTHGRLDKGMNAFKAILSPEEIRAVSEYTLTLKK